MPENIFQISFGIGKMLVYVCTRFGKNGNKNERFLIAGVVEIGGYGKVRPKGLSW